MAVSYYGVTWWSILPRTRCEVTRSGRTSHHGLQFIYLSLRLGWEDIPQLGLQTELFALSMLELVSEHSQFLCWTVSDHISSVWCVSWWPDQPPREWCCDKSIGEHLDLVVFKVQWLWYTSVYKCVSVWCIVHVKNAITLRSVVVLVLEVPAGGDSSWWVPKGD